MVREVRRLGQRVRRVERELEERGQLMRLVLEHEEEIARLRRIVASMGVIAATASSAMGGTADVGAVQADEHVLLVGSEGGVAPHGRLDVGA